MTAAALKLSFSRAALFSSLVCFALTLFFLWQRITPATLTFSNFPQTTNSYLAQAVTKPNTLSIPELNIDSLPIIAGQISGSRWPVSPSGVIHLSTTPPPGAIGNSIIYGHNWPSLLGPLNQAQVGQLIKVTDQQGETTLFTISKITTVTPDQTQLLAPTTTPVLTIYTCTGFLDTLRLVITATPI